MFKIALFDVDGVAIKKHEYFSQFLSREYGIPSEAIMPFFKNEFKACSLGKADLKTEISRYLDSWDWKHSIDDLLRIWFENESQIDMDLISSVEKLRKSGIMCFLATNQEKYRLDYLLNEIGLGSYFDGVFASCELGYTKSEQGFYDCIFQKLDGIKPSDVVFWDSDEKIIELATKYGINAKPYNAIEDLSWQ